MGQNITYTCIFESSTFVTGSAGLNTAVSAVRAPSRNATVVKNPKTLWTRLRAECIAAELKSGINRRFYADSCRVREKNIRIVCCFGVCNAWDVRPDMSIPQVAGEAVM